MPAGHQTLPAVTHTEDTALGVHVVRFTSCYRESMQMLFFLMCTHRHIDLNMFVCGHVGELGAALHIQLSLQILSQNHIFS